MHPNSAPTLSSPSSMHGNAYRSGGRPRIAIVGRGFSGAAAAAALLRAIQGPFALVLIDEAETLGGGLAYGKARAGELLNVRARDLALVAEERGDFGVWLRRRLRSPKTVGAPLDLDQTFAPRALFRDYARERLLEEMLRRPEVNVQFIDGRATSLARTPSGDLAIGFDRGPPVNASHVILAAGYGGAGARHRFGRDPFEPIGAQELQRARDIVIVGSGLTMVDALLRLRREGCAANITIVSRHGKSPLPQLARSPSPELRIAVPKVSLRVLVREIREGARAAEAAGRSWQAVINGLRPSTQDLWLSLSLTEQRRFLRHMRAFWDIHRHRLPADIHAQVAHEMARERTKLRAGRVIAVEDGSPARVSVRWRGAADAELLAADIVLDCSGHRPDLAAPLLRSALENGLASGDGHGVGLQTRANGLVESAAPGRLYAIGPLCAGSLLEIGAAPEIAAQARELAHAIAAEINCGTGQADAAPA